MTIQASPFVHFPGRYGSWAIIAGASEGIGRAIAEELAAAGHNLLLVARRESVLQAAADELSASYGIEAIPVPLDLSEPGSGEKLLAAAGDRDVGFLVHNAGADTYGKAFIDVDLDGWSSMIARNVQSLTEITYAFAKRFAAQRRGAIVIVSSSAALGGSARIGIYSATKAFGLNLGESLWAELAPFGVDVLSVVVETSDTPSLRALVSSKGIDPGALQLETSADVARQSLERVAAGPTFFLGEAHSEPVNANARRKRTEEISAFLGNFYG